MVLLSSGNLSVTQSVINILEQHKHADQAEPRIWNVEQPVRRRRAWSATRCARCSGATARTWRRATSTPAPPCSWAGRSRARSRACSTSIRRATSSRPRHDTIYFQLGESKYGKPMLDRVITTATHPADAAKCVLISFDSTIRSNISVGLPIDMLWYPRDSLRVGLQKRIERGRPLLHHAAPGLGRGPAAGVRASFPIPTGWFERSASRVRGARRTLASRQPHLRTRSRVSRRILRLERFSHRILRSVFSVASGLAAR